MLLLHPNTHKACSKRPAWKRLLVGVSCILFGSVAAFAAEPLALEPGNWKLVTRPELNGAPMVAAPRTTWLCLTEDSIRAGNIPIPMLPACQVSGGKWSGSQLQLQFTCQSLATAVSTTGVLNAAGASLDGRINVTLNPDANSTGSGTVAYIFTGQRQQATCTPP